MIRIIGNRGIAEIVLLFILVMIIGFIITVKAVQTSNASILYNSLADPKFIYFAYFLDFVLFILVLLLIVRRHKRHRNTIVYILLEGLVISFTSFFMFLLVFAILLPQYIATGGDYVLAATLALVLIITKERFPYLRDLAAMTSGIGSGILLGFNIPFAFAILLFAVFAFYDYIAVFRTKELVNIANTIREKNMAFLVSVSDLESVPKKLFSKLEVAKYRRYLKKENIYGPISKEMVRKGRLPVISQISIGEGDLIMPLMIVISSYMYFSSYIVSLFIMLGSIIGLLATMYLLKRYEHPLPALPALFSFIIISSGIVLTLNYRGPVIVAILFFVIGAVFILTDIAMALEKWRRGRRNRKERLL